MIGNSKVSILMNGYNAEKYLKEAIDSIYAQTFKNWEIIFIDNCSSDNTKKIVDSYDDKIKYFKTEVNMPIGAARNFGLQYCKCEYLAFLDTDDIWLNDKLEQQIDILEKNKKFQFCYGGVIYIDENSIETGRMLPVAKSGNVFSQQLIRYEINQQAIILRNNIEIKINETLRHSPDFNMFINIASKYEGYVIDDYIVKYRKHSDSLTSKNIDIWWSEMKMILDTLFIDTELKSKYLNEYQFAYAKVAYYKARYLMSVKKRKDASLELSKYKFLDRKYFILYVLSLLPIYFWDMVHRLK